MSLDLAARTGVALRGCVWSETFWASPLGEINPVLCCLMWPTDATKHNWLCLAISEPDSTQEASVWSMRSARRGWCHFLPRGEEISLPLKGPFRSYQTLMIASAARHKWHEFRFGASVCACVRACYKLAWWVLFSKSGANPSQASGCSVCSGANISPLSCKAAGSHTEERRMMSDRFTYPKSSRSTQRHTHMAQCATSSSPAALSLNLSPLCAGSGLPALYLFVMLITKPNCPPLFLSTCIHCVLLPPPPFGTMYLPSRGTFKSLPASLAAPGTNYITQQPSPFQLLQQAGTDRNLDLVSLWAALHLSLLR